MHLPLSPIRLRNWRRKIIFPADQSTSSRRPITPGLLSWRWEHRGHAARLHAKEQKPSAGGFVWCPAQTHGSARARDGGRALREWTRGARACVRRLRMGREWNLRRVFGHYMYIFMIAGTWAKFRMLGFFGPSLNSRTLLNCRGVRRTPRRAAGVVEGAAVCWGNEESFEGYHLDGLYELSVPWQEDYTKL